MHRRHIAWLAVLLSFACLDPVNPPGPDAGNPDGADLGGADLTEVDEQAPDDCTRSPCPDRVPICDTGQATPMCRACQPGEDDAACAARNPRTKRCAGGGRCVECLSAADCAAGMVCNANTCEACTNHAQCASQVCDVYQQNGGGSLGACVPEGSIVYVDNRDGACGGMHAGTRADPVCTIEEGRQKMQGDAGKTALRLAPRTRVYERATASIRTKVAIYGPADATRAMRAQIGGDLNNDVFTLADGADVILDGVEVYRGNVGIRCSGTTAKLALRRSWVLASASTGLESQGCTVTIDRSYFSGNRNGALSLAGRGSYTVQNSFLVANGGNAAVRVSDESMSFRFRFNTVGGNIAMVPAGINCGQTERLIESSIFSGNTIPPGRTSQFFGNCRLMANSVVVGAVDTITGGRQLDPEFEQPAPMMGALPDYRLKDAMKSRDCCIDKAPAAMDLRGDFFGTARPQGGGYDIGAHEVK